MSSSSSMVLEVWTEKYRPKTLDDFADREAIVRRLKGFVKEKNLPNLLFIGPTGTGKTAAILALAHDLYGEDYGASILEVSAPAIGKDTDFVRGRVKSFARSATLGDIPFRLVIIDEADNLSKVAQQALRRTMEKWRTVRFCLIGNVQSKIIDPIQSRCALFVFHPYDEGCVRDRVKHIAEKEGVKITEDGVNTIVEISRGDLRKAVNALQAASALGVVDQKTIYEVVSGTRPEEVRAMLLKALGGDFVGSREILRRLLVERGLSGFDVINQVYIELFGLKISDKLRLEMLSMLGDIDYRLTQGATDEVQLSALLAKLVLIGSKPREGY